ncbi:MAG: polyprenyl synthetase family protein, partial [Candidatus Omnitrophota bacterium]
LSAKAAQDEHADLKGCQLANIAAAMELIHMASLVHDDIIDKAKLRHNKPTVNYKWGSDVSIALGDYLYSIAFELISGCANTDVLECISSAMKSMCEGELVQVLERDNLNLLRQRYLVIVKKKTASLFAASCRAGSILVSDNRARHNALKDYGLNFGIAFQILDDCLDLIGKEEELGKTPGADFKMGELTLPVLNLLSQGNDGNRILALMKEQNTEKAFRQIRERFIGSDALERTKKDISFYIRRAKKSLDRLSKSCFKDSLSALADYVAEKLEND